MVSADGQFLTLVPRETWLGPEGGRLQVEIRGRYPRRAVARGAEILRRPRRRRLRGDARVRGRAARLRAPPYRVPAEIGDPGSVFELARYAAPNPTMLPSWNQIGFDSLHYLGGAVEGDASRALVWVVGGRLADGRTVIDPASTLRFPLRLEYDGGLLTLHNYDLRDPVRRLLGHAVRVVPRVHARHPTAASSPPALSAVADCDRIERYGPFLKLMGLSEWGTGLMHIVGGADMSLWDGAARASPRASARRRRGRRDEALARIEAARSGAASTPSDSSSSTPRAVRRCRSATPSTPRSRPTRAAP